jgi:membrane protease YdiL (CAAX protease family)
LDDHVPFDYTAVVAVACALLAGLTWFAALVIGLGPYVPGDLAAILVRNHQERLDVVGAFAVALLLTLLLIAAALVIGRTARRRVLRNRGSLRGKRVAWLGMVAAIGVAVLLVLLLAFIADATQSEYVDAVRCLQPGVCINP